ncbi:TPA: TMEM165/GDT1 family protein [Candidatus Bathyarchaeota archaeon]|nr:TMEM165/GDT1 family protein [Candidatus Bathyarchaeota archaeon]
MDLTPLISSFGLVILSELGDKTNIATITLSARHKPLPVFLGAILAFSLVDGISVLMGRALAAMIPSSWVGVGSGVAFVLFGALTLFTKATEGGVKSRRSSFATSFLLIASMELGDKTQLAAIVLAARYDAPVPIFLGVMSAFLVVTVISVSLGTGLRRLVPYRYVRILASVVFILFGVLLLLSTAGLLARSAQMPSSGRDGQVLHRLQARRRLDDLRYGVYHQGHGSQIAVYARLYPLPDAR